MVDQRRRLTPECWKRSRPDGRPRTRCGLKPSPGDSEKRLERYQPEHSAHAYFQERYAAVERGLSEEIRRRQIDGLLDPKTAPYEAVVMFISLSDELQMRRLIDLSIDMAAALRTAIDSLTRLSVKRAQPTPA